MNKNEFENAKAKNVKKIAFIGAGVMGKNMIKNLIDKGVEVDFYSRTKDTSLDLIEYGANWHDSIKECISDHKIIITMVGFPADVQEVYLSEGGIISNARKGAYLIDMTTTDPKLAIQIGEEARKRELHFLDAPVSGSDIRAKDATLTIMVGASSVDYENCYPIFKYLGKIIIHEGPVGTGQRTKMANQIAIAGAISGVCEALYYAKKVGLDENKTLITISSGAAGSFQMDNMAPKILDDDYDPGFFIKHFVKDMNIAKSETDSLNFSLPILEEVLQNYRDLIERGYGDLGIQGLYKYYDNAAEIEK